MSNIYNHANLSFDYLLMKRFDNILILWALPKTQEDLQLYWAIAKVCDEVANTISSPIDTADFKWTDVERYDRAFQKVREADLVIWDQSKPSTWQGMEVRECAILNKPLIIVAKEWSIVSGLVKWCPITKEIIYYKDLQHLQSQLSSVIKNLEFRI